MTLMKQKPSRKQEAVKSLNYKDYERRKEESTKEAKK